MQTPLTQEPTSVGCVKGLGLSLDQTRINDEEGDREVGSSSKVAHQIGRSSLDDVIKDAFVTGYQSAVNYSAEVEFGELHRGTLGPEQIVALVAEGYSPDEIGYQIADHESLVEQFRRLVMTSVRDMALGYTVCQLADQLLNIDSLSDNEKAARLTAVRSRMAEMNRGPITTTTQLPKYKYDALYEYVEAQLHNGDLVGDPAWANETSKRKKKTVTWQDRLIKSIAMLDHAFDEAVKKLDWVILTQIDGELLCRARPEDFSKSAVRIFRQLPVTLPQGPARPGSSSSLSTSSAADTTSATVPAQTIRTVGRSFRTVLLDTLKRRGNEHFALSQYVQAEESYQQAILGGTNDPATAINLALVLLKLEKFRQAENAATIGLYQIDAASNTQIKDEISSVSASTASKPIIVARQNEASDRFQGSDAELAMLKYKALIRRGRARRGRALSEQIGAAEGDNPPASGILDSQESGRKPMDAESVKKLLLGARSDFTEAMKLDPHDETARVELNVLARLEPSLILGLSLTQEEADVPKIDQPPAVQRGASDPIVPSTSLL